MQLPTLRSFLPKQMLAAGSRSKGPCAPVTPSRRPTRRQFLIGASQLASAALVVGCAPANPVPKVEKIADQLVLPEPIFSTVRTRPNLPKTIQPALGGISESLDIQIGQMILAGFNGQQVTTASPIVRDISNGRIGSVALFGRNIATVDQVKALTGALQSVAQTPLLISVDQEGGQVRRIGSGFGIRTNYSAAQLGRLNDIGATQSHAESTAKTLSELGINLNLAPVVDLNVNPANPIIGSKGRSFSDDPHVVTDQALAFIEAHHKEGLFCTLKHFPGHGSSTADSHFGFVDVTETWSEEELKPFEEIIRSGRCDAVMTAHIFNANIDAEHPATLSKATITGILRERMNYQGVIMTDDIQMGAIRNYYNFDQAIELALDAGVDIFSISRYTPYLVDRVFATVHSLLAENRISEERIYTSYRRILALKSRMQVPSTFLTRTDSSARPTNALAEGVSSKNVSPTSTTADGAADIVDPSAYIESLDRFLD